MGNNNNNKTTTTKQQHKNNNNNKTKTTKQQQQNNNNNTTTSKQQQQNNNKITTTTTTKQQQQNDDRQTGGCWRFGGTASAHLISHSRHSLLSTITSPQMRVTSLKTDMNIALKFDRCSRWFGSRLRKRMRPRPVRHLERDDWLDDTGDDRGSETAVLQAAQMTGDAAGLPPPWLGPAPAFHCTCARQMAPPDIKYRPHTEQTKSEGYRRDVGAKRRTGPTRAAVATGRAAESRLEQKFCLPRLRPSSRAGAPSHWRAGAEAGGS